MTTKLTNSSREELQLCVHFYGILMSVRGHSINLHVYTILAVPSNCAQRSLINNISYNLMVSKTCFLDSGRCHLETYAPMTSNHLRHWRIVEKGKDWRNLR